jgi:membrane protein
MYWLIPHGKLKWSVIFVSALSASLLWEVAKQLFGLYISNIVTLNRIYGTYALFVIVGFWIYYTSIVFILGAEIGQLYRERHEKEEPIAPGHA